jgi:hypothetical protein
VADALRPFSSSAYLLSALDQEIDDVIKAAFGVNLPRLVAIKKKYDPTCFLRVNRTLSRSERGF